MSIANLNKEVQRLVIWLTVKCLYNYKLGVARTILAFSSLLTLIVNDSKILFDRLNDPSMVFLHKVNLFFIFGEGNLTLTKAIGCFILLLVIIGWRPRITGILHFWVCISFVHSTTMIEGGDQIASNVTLLLVPITLLDSRKWHWLDTDMGRLKKLISNYFYLIIKLQISLIYFHAAVGKMPIKEWANGTAVYYWFNDPVYGMKDWQRIFLDPILSNPFGVAFLTWGTLVLEVLLFMSIIMSERYRIIMLKLGITFHLGILIIHGLVSFFITMTGVLLIYLWVDVNSTTRLNIKKRNL